MAAGQNPFPNEPQDQAPPPPSAKLTEELLKEIPKRTNAELLDLIIQAGDNSQGYAKQIVESELLRDQFVQDQRLAKVFAASGVFSDIKGTTEIQAVATAMTKIQLGRSWGVSPADAMQFIYFTNGRPAVMGELFAAKLKDAGYDWDTAFHYVTEPGKKSRKCIGCTLLPKKWNPEKKQYEPMMSKTVTDSGTYVDAPLEVHFTKEDADSAMIWEKNRQIKLSEKWNFQSWAEDMYFWRALGRFRRRYATNVLKGAVSKEEAEDYTPAPSAPAPLFAVGQQEDGTLVVDK